MIRIINKYKIIYNQFGGKPFDYFFYRYINSFIYDKKIVLTIVNSFSEGIKKTDYPNLILLLKGNKVSDENISKMMNLLDTIDHLDFIYPMTYTSIYLSTFDRIFLNIQKTILNDAELLEKIKKVPNIRLKTSHDFSKYIQYILNHRYPNYFETDQRRFIKDFITKQIYTDSINTDTIKLIHTQIDNQIINIYRKYKKIREIEEEIIIELNKSKLHIEGVLSKTRHHYLFTFTNPIVIDEFKLLFNETNKRALIYPILEEGNNLSMDNIYPILFKSDVPNSLTTTHIKFIFRNNKPDKLGERISVYFVSDRTHSILKSKLKLIQDYKDDIQGIKKNITSTTDFTPFLKNYQINNIKEEYNYYGINSTIKEEVLRYSVKVNITGEGYEEQILFFSVLKICLDNPDININNIRIYSGIEINFITPSKRYQVGELDILIVNEKQEIVAIGEIKSSIDSIQTAYKQLTKLQEMLKQIDSLQFINSNKEEIKLGISPELIRSINENSSPEDIKYFYIITRDQELGDFNPGHVTEFLTKLNENNVIKLDNGKFILNPEVSEETLYTLSVEENVYLEENEVELTSEILRRYIGKNNIIILKNNRKLLNAVDLLSKAFFPPVE